jgi:hypothetical protein
MPQIHPRNGLYFKHITIVKTTVSVAAIWSITL